MHLSLSAIILGLLITLGHLPVIYGAEGNTQTLSKEDEALLNPEELSELGDEALNSGQDPDPLEPMNRFFFTFNRILDGIILKPGAYLYKSVIHEDIQISLENIVDTVFLPISILNYALQGRGEMMLRSLNRFSMNVLYGFGGIFDIAKPSGLPSETTDTNQTLAIWGMEQGPYIMIPLLGPATFRSALGLVADWYAVPWIYLINNMKHHRIATRNKYYAINCLDFTQKRARLLDVLNDIEKTSIDPYVTTREYFLQYDRGRSEPTKIIEYVGAPTSYDDRK